MKILGRGKHLEVWKLLQMKARKIPRILMYNLCPFLCTFRNFFNTLSRKMPKKHVFGPKNFRMFRKYIWIAYHSIGLLIIDNFYRSLMGLKTINDRLVSEKPQKLPLFHNFFHDFIIDHSSKTIQLVLINIQI